MNEEFPPDLLIVTNEPLDWIPDIAYNESDLPGLIIKLFALSIIFLYVIVLSLQKILRLSEVIPAVLG
jgi:hypothetical protein